MENIFALHTILANKAIFIVCAAISFLTCQLIFADTEPAKKIH
jgi:hypothetical protein